MVRDSRRQARADPIDPRRRQLTADQDWRRSDLNARRAAENLHLHVNTAHYRLARIAERTGCDLRRVSDLIEILIAARLAEAAARD